MGARGVVIFLWLLVVASSFGFLITCVDGLVSCSSRTSNSSSQQGLHNNPILPDKLEYPATQTSAPPVLPMPFSIDEVQMAINRVYAKYGVEFRDPTVQQWANQLPGYRPVPGRSYAEAEALFSYQDRVLVERLAARRRELKEGASNEGARPTPEPSNNTDRLLDEIDQF